MGHYFGWVGGGWVNILDGWGSVGMRGVEWGWVGVSVGGCTG